MNNENEKLNPNGRIVLPANQIPSFNVALAVQRGVEKNIIFRSYGGAGDIVASIPTVEFALREFGSWAKISLASEIPVFFQHLKFERVFDLNKEQPIWENYLVFDLIVPTTNIKWEIMSHMVTNCCDFPTLCALRSTLPIADKEIHMIANPPKKEILDELEGKNIVYFHCGKHWQSKTFSPEYWNLVLKIMMNNGVIPVLIGGSLDDNRGTVDVDPTGCIDLRGKLTWEDSVYLLQRAKVLISNDSSPIHIAASHDPNDKENTGHCWIGCIATVKRPDYIFHWRHGQWSYRSKNLSHGGAWELFDSCPNKSEEVRVDEVSTEILEGWLPTPEDVLKFVKEKLSE